MMFGVPFLLLLKHLLKDIKLIIVVIFRLLQENLFQINAAVFNITNNNVFNI